LLALAQHERSRECLLLLEAILETPGLDRRLAEVLRPKLEPSHRDAGRHEPSRHELARRETEKTAARPQGRKNGARKHVKLHVSLKEKKPRGGAHK